MALAPRARAIPWSSCQRLAPARASARILGHRWLGLTCRASRMGAEGGAWLRKALKNPRPSLRS